MGCRLWGRTESDTTESDLAVAATYPGNECRAGWSLVNSTGALLSGKVLGMWGGGAGRKRGWRRVSSKAGDRGLVGLETLSIAYILAGQQHHK